MTSVGRFERLRMTLAAVNVLPEPVTPRSVWWRLPAFIDLVSLAMA